MIFLAVYTIINSIYAVQHIYINNINNRIAFINRTIIPHYLVTVIVGCRLTVLAGLRQSKLLPCRQAK